MKTHEAVSVLMLMAQEVGWLLCIICNFTCSDTFGCVAAVPKHSQLYSNTTSSLTVKYIIYDALILKSDLVRLGRCAFRFTIIVSRKYCKGWRRMLGNKVHGVCRSLIEMFSILLARAIQVCSTRWESSGVSGDHKGAVQTMQHHFNHWWWQEKPSIHFLPLIYDRPTERLEPVLAVMRPEAGYTLHRPLRHRETHSCSHLHQPILESQMRRICTSLDCWSPWREPTKTLGKYASYT